VTADEALQLLKAGNARFLAGQEQNWTTPLSALVDLAKGQQPFATILGCSDSRVAPERIFDAGLGELFVVRLAGNVLTPEAAGSLQYAHSYLDTPLLLVLGHEGCGAVKAALQTKFEKARIKSRIQMLVDSIVPALEGMREDLPPDVQLRDAVEANVRWTVQAILQTPEGQARQAEGRMKVAGAVYEIETGVVRFLDQ
jgi:carbonic anhydrase